MNRIVVRLSQLILVNLLFSVLLVASVPSRVLAAPGDATTVGTLSLASTIENIGVIACFSGDANGNNQATLEYRKVGDITWKPGIAMTVDRRDSIIMYGAPPTSVPNPYKNQWRAVIFWLTPNTSYEVRVTFSDADGVVGTNPVTATVTTRDDNPPSNGNTYYVAKNGNDSTGNGSSTNPWLTISKAATMVAPGDTVRIRPGTYTEQVVLVRSGTLTNYITWRSDDYSNMAQVTAPDVGYYGTFRIIGISYNRISHLKIDNIDEGCVNIGGSSIGIIVEDSVLTSEGSDFWAGGVIIRGEGNPNPPSFTLVQRNTMTATATGSDGPFGVLRSYTGGGNVIRDNVITGPFHDDIESDGHFSMAAGDVHDSYVYRNTVDNSQDDGIEMEGPGINCAAWGNVISNFANDAIGLAAVTVGPTYIFRNVAYGGNGAMYKLGSSSYGFTYIYHNTTYTNGIPCQGAATYGNDDIVDNTFFLNNIIQVVDTYTVREGMGGLSKMSFDYDSMYSPQYMPIRWKAAGGDLSWATWRATYNQEPHGIWGPESFVNSAGGDFHLQANSPGIDKGVVLVGFNDANSPWPYQGAAPDIGAYEYNSGVPPVNSPPALSAIGNRSVTAGQLLQFTVSATDPNGNRLTYSASNLPAGAGFDPSTKTFSWTPSFSQAGSYPAVHFEVSNSRVTVHEDITIEVRRPFSRATLCMIIVTAVFVAITLVVALLYRRRLRPNGDS